LRKQNRTALNKIIFLTIFCLGFSIVVISFFYVSSFLAILGVAIIFWGAILRYITPIMQVPLTLLNASTHADASNIERVLVELDLKEKGVYLPPNSLKNMEYCVVFVPKNSQSDLPSLEEGTKKLFSKQQNGIFVTPPGIGLSRVFERGLYSSFTKVDLRQLQKVLPRLLIEDLELVDNIEIQIQGEIFTATITGSLLNSVCIETDNQPCTHMQVGCLLSSALACVLAKVTEKPVTIQNETRMPKSKTTIITYRIEEM
jgi:hypothetical protein